jgi:DNA-binding transcriptional ArsR family regulator
MYYGDARSIGTAKRVDCDRLNKEWTMTSQSAFAEVAALAGDPARAGMLHALMDGRALTATELARVAGITPQTASGHLARLAVAGLLVVEKQGRHRYHRLASPAVAQMMESIMQVAAGLDTNRPRLVVGPRDAALRAARTCYDHLAGHLGVALADALVEGGQVELASDGGVVTDAGIRFFSRIGIDLDSVTASSGARFASCAGPASTGVSDAPTSRARLAQPCAHTVSRRVGYAVTTAPAPSRSRRRDNAFFATSLTSDQGSCCRTRCRWLSA